MTVQTFIKDHLNDGVAISGGSGQSFEDAIIFGAKEKRRYVKLEYRILELLQDYNRVKIDMDQQVLLKENGRVYDRLELVLTHRIPEFQSRTEIYFDVTDCSDIPPEVAPDDPSDLDSNKWTFKLFTHKNQHYDENNNDHYCAFPGSPSTCSGPGTNRLRF